MPCRELLFHPAILTASFPEIVIPKDAPLFVTRRKGDGADDAPGGPGEQETCPAQPEVVQLLLKSMAQRSKGNSAGCSPDTDLS